MSSETPSFKKIQYAFTAHLRNPDQVSAPDEIEDRRMEIYRGLLYRNIQNFIAKAFPVLRKLYSDDNWQRMVRNFFANHQSTSPYFKDISREFLDYLQNERKPQPEDPVFINELAYYEWIEIYLTYADIEPDLTQIDRAGDLMQGVPVLSPLTELRNYNFPVHKIKPDFQPKQANEQSVFLMVYRDMQDKVGFMELNPITAALVELIKINSLKTGRQLLEEVAQTLQHPNPDVVYKGGEQALEQLRTKDILLGTKL